MSRYTVHLVDASLYVFRAWHSAPPEFFGRRRPSGQRGLRIHALPARFHRTRDAFALRRRLRRIADEFVPQRDLSGIQGQPRAAARRTCVQFGYRQRIAAALGLRVLSDTSFEADDLIGSVVHALRPQEFRSVIVSADKDFGQLVGEHDEIWDFSKNQKWNSAGVKERARRASAPGRRLPRADRRCDRQHSGRRRHRREDRRHAARAFRQSRCDLCTHRRNSVPAFSRRRRPTPSSRPARRSHA